MRPVSHGVCVSVHLGRKYNFTKGSLISSLMGLKRPKGSDGDCAPRRSAANVDIHDHTWTLHGLSRASLPAAPPCATRRLQAARS